MMNSKDMLFSIPTLSDSLPPLDPQDSSTVPGDALRLHEDDWRQIEFVLTTDRTTVERELAELARFRVDKRSGPGWTEIYVRKSRIDSIRPRGAHLSELLRAGIKQGQRTALYLDSGGTSAKVRGGFAVKLKGLVVYGNTGEGDALVSLGLQSDDLASLDDAQRQTILDICRSLDAFVVDWYANKIVAP